MAELAPDSLVALERAGWDALCEQAGGAFYGDLMTEDGLMVLVNGMVLDREAVVASLAEAPTWDRYEILEPRIVALGPHAASLVYRARAERRDEPAFEALMSSTYVLVGGQPRLALYQQTTITHA